MTTETLQRVSPASLMEHPEAHRIPMMSAAEWDDFLDNIRSTGQITTPVHALPNRSVFDGRHRLRAALELGIPLIPVITYDISEAEAIQFISNSAVLRRSLTPGQCAAIVLEFSELVEGIREAAKERQRKAGTDFGRGLDEKVFPDLEKAIPKHTHVDLAEKAGIGKSSMAMLQAVQRDEPELFEEVKAGKRTINSAYTEAKNRKEPEPSQPQSSSSVSKSEPPTPVAPIKPIDVWAALEALLVGMHEYDREVIDELPIGIVKRILSEDAAIQRVLIDVAGRLSYQRYAEKYENILSAVKSGKPVASICAENNYKGTPSAIDFEHIDPEEILGVNIYDNEAVVKKKYRGLVQRVHADTGGSDFLVKLVKDAYERFIG